MSHEKINLCKSNKFLYKSILVIILIIITFSFTNDILFTTTSPSFTTVNITTTVTTTTIPLPSPSFDSEEKFLTYLPHNGFHNQRLALINGIILSYITNRTLIMPPILINYAPGTSTFYSLYNVLSTILEAKQYRKDHCYKDDENDEHNFCNNTLYSIYDDFTMLNWDQLFDFNEIRKHVKIVNRGYDFSLDNLKYNFNIGENDTYLFIEDKPYKFEFFDNDNSTRQINKVFKKKFFISNLKKIDEKLLHLSSLFSSKKIILENQDNIEFRQFIHNKLMVNDPRLLNISDKIIKKLGGKGNYIGLHIRVLDGFFRDVAEHNKDLLYNELMSYLLKSDLLRKSKIFFKYNLKECVANNIPIIYIATDSKDRRNRLRKFYKKIPCVFSLIDFSKDLDTLSYSSSDFDKDVNLKDFYVPIIDLLITAHGKVFFGTPKSTYSEMANEVNNLSNGKNAI
ncbi:hypothetical protein RclHR1_02430004 [Rhizophagus clarus]|uniref:CigA protein n=1 Tax=Rhizophagus clarus TaxID=94130 RepID=A0A2Z6QXD4_9GLOM|nr:hypothetical protein RclHR1_02430004 [Rhizophagus clarus]GET02520.1 CigA protein [Rhizophagus clarus]